MTLDSLFNVLTGGRQANEDEQPDANPLGALLGGSGGLDLGGLLDGLLGREKDEADGGEDSSLAQLGLSPAVLQAGLALVLGRLREGGTSEAGGLDLGALLQRAGEKDEADEEAVAATGLPGQLAAIAGIDLDDALKAIQTILALLAGKKPTTRKRSTTSKSKAKTTRKSTTRKKATTAKATTRKATTNKARKTKESAASGAKRTTTKRATTKKDADGTDKPKRASTSRAKSKTTSKAKPAKTTTKRTTRKKSLGETLALPADMVDVLKKPAGE